MVVLGGFRYREGHSQLLFVILFGRSWISYSLSAMWGWEEGGGLV